MTSDLVAGLRRRAPVQLISALGSYTDYRRVLQYNTDIGGVSISIVIDTVNGNVRVSNELTGALLYTATRTYLIAASRKDIRCVTLDDAVYICNVKQKPTLVDSADMASYPDPSRWGYFYIPTGAYSKTYEVTLTNRTTGTAYTVSYTTPNGTQAAHAAQSTPEYIADQLRIAAVTAWAPVGAALYITGGYVAVRGNVGTQLTVSSSSGTSFVRGSNAASIRDVAELPAVLPPAAVNLIIAVGPTKEKTYYRYDHPRRVWVEDAAWEFLEQPSNMPIRLTVSGGVYSLASASYERRSAGDEDNNPVLRCIADGITGMAAFQGRLVLLSNEYVCMSASNNPLRWFRSTVATLVDNDPIETAAQGALTSPYEWAEAFNKDLILFGRRYQGVVPGSNVITPRNAQVSLMTQYEVDTAARPVTAGRSVFFGSPRSLGFVGMHEMTPSQYTDAYYEADDVTNHVPRYIPGPWRFLAGSTTANILVGGFTGDANALLVHEYLWAGGEKVHAAWHRWEFAWPVVDAYFSGDVLIALFAIDGTLYLCHVDVQRGAGVDGAQDGRLDFHRYIVCTVPGELRLPLYMQQLGVMHAFKTGGTGTYLGQALPPGAVVGADYVVSCIGAAVGDIYQVGCTYRSSAIPTAPVIKDAKGVPITTSRAVLHRWRVSLANTGRFTYIVGDQIRSNPEVEDTALRWYSRNLDAGLPLADTTTVTVPGRVDMHSASLELATTDYYDLNIQAIEYGFRFHQRFRRS